VYSVTDLLLSSRFWEIIGISAAVIFYGRFYIQWIVSEIQGRSTIPTVFWYMSSAGSLMLLGYAVWLQSPIGALSHSFNIVIYARNLFHIWRQGGTLTRIRNVFLHGIAGGVIVLACCLLAWTWLREFESTRDSPVETVRQTWLWLGIGTLGQVLFGCRFLLQWLATERKRKSVIPVAFWYISIVAALLLMSAHFHRREWVFGTGIAATVLIYLRNLWLIHQRRETVPGG
jgi:lipid-A-disaccharide synthase-like uncharacterized protein